MDTKMPYYMAYPMPFSYDDERTERMDYEYLKSMYPDTAKRIMPYVEEECDRMEYENSMVYDEYPDKLQLIYEDEDQRISEGNTEGEKISATVRERGRNRDNSPASLRDFIEVMLYQELYKRRCDHRRRCRRFY